MKQHERDEFFDPPERPAPAPAAAAGGEKGSAEKKAARIVALVLGGIFLAVAAFLGGWFGQYYSLDEEVRTYLWAKSVLEKNYYQPLDESELYQGLYDSLSVDPYTQFYPPAEYDSYLAQGAGENKDAGIYVYREQKAEDLTQVFLSAENSPACLAGIKKGMYVLAFGTSENDLTEGNYGDFKAFVSTHKGAVVVRCGYHTDGSDAKNYTIASKSYQTSFLTYRDSETSYGFRGDGSVLTLTETDMPLVGADDKTAYIRLEEFSGNNTPSEFVQLLKKMKERGREHLVLDLRSNGGGYLDLLGDIASHLMRNATEKHPMFTYTESRSGQKTNYLCAQSDFSSYFSPSSRIYVLADECSASASECLIGVLVDYGTVPYSCIYLREDDAGVAKTFGKGIMQTHFDNANGASMKLTTATVHWPVSGRCIHGVGVTSADGAVPIPAPFVWGERDVMLDEVLSRICG